MKAGWMRRRGRPRERGAVTAELAVALPGLMLLLVLLAGGGAAAVAQLRLEEAARAAARSLARGEPPAVAESEAHRLAGDSVGVSISSDGGFGVVRLTAAVPGPLAGLAPWSLKAEAHARLEEPAGGPAQLDGPDGAA